MKQMDEIARTKMYALKLYQWAVLGEITARDVAYWAKEVGMPYLPEPGDPQSWDEWANVWTDSEYEMASREM